MEGREVETQHGYHPLPRVLLVSHATVGKEEYQADVRPQTGDCAGWTHLAKMSAWARLSPIISRNERLSSMNDGREMRVMSIPTRSCDRMWKMTDL